MSEFRFSCRTDDKRDWLNGDIVALYLATNAGEFVTDGDLRGFRRRGEGNVRFRRMEFFDRNGLPIASPRTGEEINIVLEFDGSYTQRRSVRIGIKSDDAPTPGCSSAPRSVLRRSVLIGAGDKIACRIPRLPLSAGRYNIVFLLGWIVETPLAQPCPDVRPDFGKEMT